VAEIRQSSGRPCFMAHGSWLMAHGSRLRLKL